MAQLSRATLRSVPRAARPLITPGEVPAGVVHVGVGAFHRAHQAVYTEAAIAASGGPWAIIGVAPNNRAIADTLNAQNGLYSLTRLSDGSTHTRVVGAIKDMAHARSDPETVVHLLADPSIRVVTLTVTEKAYRLDPATGELRADDQLRAELAGTSPPATVPGLLVTGLRTRERADAGPIAVVSCDNLPANGARLRRAVFAAYELAGHDTEWLGAHVRFPSTMVDRIVPAPEPATIETARSALGLLDAAAVATEPFSEWVIEDDFPGGRPDWAAAGAILTDDTEPHERLKLRVLNGVHSALAYLGALAGCETIAEALRLTGMVETLERFVADDAGPSLTPPPGVSVAEYGDTVFARFANPAIVHRTLQVAMDGSQKLPQRLLHTIADRRSAGAMPHSGALILAAWMQFVAGRADDGTDLPLDDPLHDRIRDALASGSDPVDALFGISDVFSAQLADDDELRDEVRRWHDALARHGVEAVLAATTAGRKMRS